MKNLSTKLLFVLGAFVMAIIILIAIIINKDDAQIKYSSSTPKENQGTFEGYGLIKKGDSKKWLYFEENKVTPVDLCTTYKKCFGLTTEDSLGITLIKKTDSSEVRYSIQQFRSGVIVEGATAYFHTKNGFVYRVKQSFLENAKISNSVKIDKKGLTEILTNLIPVDSLSALEFAKESELVLINMNEDSNIQPEIRYCWKAKVVIQDPTKTRFVFIDAETGELKKSQSLIFGCSTGTGITAHHGVQTIHTQYVSSILGYRLYDDCSHTYYTAKIQTIEGNPNPDYYDSDNNWTSSGDIPGVQTHWSAHQVLDYFGSYWGRNSYDGNGSELVCFNDDALTSIISPNTYYDGNTHIIHLGTDNPFDNYDNYNTVDIIAHEFTHGITQSTAQLIYEKESGALNESFSDIFGTAVQRWVTGTDNWEMGEERGTPIRSLSNPKLYGQPNTRFGKNWYPLTGCTPNDNNDKCGVHTNSGPQNYWFYLLVNGGNGTNDIGNTFNVAGIGFADAIKITYRNLTNELSNQDNYDDAREGSIIAATYYFGSNSKQVSSVKQAWYAVGLGTNDDISVTSITITTSSNPSNGGSTSGGGSFQNGQTCTLIASANSGYTFKNWTENGNVLSSNATFQYTVSTSKTIVANFTQNSVIPSNDDCANAITLTPNTTCSNTTGNIAGATQSYPANGCPSGLIWDVWYKFTAASNGTYTIMLSPSSNMDGVVEVRQGSCSGTVLGCADVGGGNGGIENLNVSVTDGTVYYIRVYDYNSTGNTTPPVSTNFSICVKGGSTTANNNCEISSINPSSETHGPSSFSTTSGVDDIIVNAKPNCTFSVEESCSWLTVTPMSGTTNNVGQAFLNYIIQANTTSTSRQYTFYVNGSPITIIQNGCTFDFYPTSKNVSGSGVTYNLDIDSYSPCSWIIQNLCSWVHPSQLNGSGDPRITVTVDPNTSCEPRECILILSPGNSTHKITQQGSGTAPAITNQPSNQSTIAPESVSFSITASGSNNLYQWQYNNGSGWINIQNNSLYSGTSTATLSISSTTTSMNSYQYRCYLTSSCTSATATSNGATLTVLTSSLCTAPSIPQSLSISIGNPANGLKHMLAFSVAKVSDAEGYSFEFSWDGANWIYWSEGAGTSFQADMDDLPNIPFYIRVRAFKCSPKLYSSYTYAIPQSVSTACDDPAILTVNGATTNSLKITINGETPVENPSNTTYSIYCSTTSQYVQNNGNLGSTEVFQKKAEWGTKTVTGLSNNKEYCFYPKARNNDGDLRFNPSNIACGTTVSGDSFLAIEATNITQSSFYANWTSSTNATGYYLDVSNNSSFSSFVTGYKSKNVGNVTSSQVIGLSSNTIYYYRITPYNSGIGSFSNTIKVTTLQGSTLASPVATAATNITQTSFSANWNTSSAATGCRLDIALDNTFTNYLYWYQNKDVGTQTSQVTGLAENTTYYYRVRAYNSEGVSGFSNTINATTKSSQNDAALTIGNISGSAGNTVSIPVMATNFTDVVGFQFTIVYDKTKLEYKNCSNWSGITNASDVTITPLTAEGKIVFIYNDAAVNITNSKFFDLNFSVKADANGAATLSWSDFPTPREISNSQAKEIQCSYNNGSLTIVTGLNNLTGQLTYDNTTQSLLNNVSISLLNSNNQSIAISITDASGNFSFPGLSNGNYTLNPVASMKWGGVSAMDLTLYKKHIANVNTLTQLQVKSGDVNASNSLTSIDLTIIKQRIGAQISSFPSGDWTYDPTNVDINGSKVQNIMALCYGDANGSYLPSNSRKSSSNVFLASNEKISLLNNGEFEIPFKVNKAVNKLSSVTLEINYPFEWFDVKSIRMIAHNEDLYYSVKGGIINVIYSTLNSLDLKEGDLSMTIRFGLKKDAFKSVFQDNHLEFSGTGEFGDFFDKVIEEVTLTYASLIDMALFNDYWENDIKVYPNPARDKLTITNVEDSRISVNDILGRNLMTVDCKSSPMELDIRKLLPSTYILKINKSNAIFFRKFIVVK